MAVSWPIGLLWLFSESPATAGHFGATTDYSDRTGYVFDETPGFQKSRDLGYVPSFSFPSQSFGMGTLLIQKALLFLLGILLFLRKSHRDETNAITAMMQMNYIFIDSLRHIYYTFIKIISYSLFSF
jgi:hypothetical protein